jgi:beta-galactosidase
LRATYAFNQDWRYLNREVDATVPESDFESVTIPHSNIVLPYHNFDDVEYQFISTYRKRFTLPEKLQGRRLFIDFAGVMIATTMTINGHTFPEHKGGYTPFSYDITDYVREDGENFLVVQVDSTERSDIPPFGFVVDYLTFGGIYREVALRYVEPLHISNLRVQTHDFLSDSPNISIDIHTSDAPRDGAMARAEIVDNHGVSLWQGEANLAHVSITTLTSDVLKSIQLWSPDTPNLYMLKVSLWQGETQLDAEETRFGFREVQFRDDGFYLNGELFHLRGLNRHQTYPYIGAGAPARLQTLDADIVKYDLGCNIVRTSHYPQSKHFLNRCDEIGLLVFEEIPGWQHIGDEAWRDLSLRDVRVMIERDWNHPSIILWGVRINESMDKDDFYQQTNDLAHELDPTRQTGGVRFFEGSTLLEDVYTFNDFSNTIIEPSQRPWLVTEFNGHMFPTKTFDGEERRVEHAVRHAHVQSQSVLVDGVSGAIGWCAFDYNTHLDFGSGDRICYHGVMDIFRQPKFAAHVYASQIDPQERVVLEPATNWTMGDRSAAGNDPIIIFSNCERIAVYIGDEHKGDYTPDQEQYTGLKYPPTIVAGIGHIWGGAFQPLRLVGYIGDEVVAEKRIAADSLPHHIDLQVSHDTLHADGNDMAWVWFRIVDEYNNPLPYALAPITLTLEGDGELIGDNPFPLVGGQGAVFVRAGKSADKLIIRAQAPRLPIAEITLTTQ